MKKKMNMCVALIVAMQVILGVLVSPVNADSQGSVLEGEIGWKVVDNRYLYLDHDSKPVKGWYKIGGLWYYFNSNGHMVTGTQTINGKSYAFNVDGSLKAKLSDKSQLQVVKQATAINQPQVRKVANGVYDRSGKLIGTGKRYISNASAYTGDTMTASGQVPRWGTIAVDPRVIPLGSKVYVPYYDKVFIANDTGGIIRGTMIDIFMKSARNMNNFGRRNIEIYVLDK